MVKVYFTRETKQFNSTKALDPKVEFDCEFTGAVDILNPAITIHGVEQAAVTNMQVYAYAYIPRFKRYYFVSDWVFSNGVWSASLTIDALGTYRDDILNTQVYINRAENTTADEPDDLPVTSSYSSTTSSTTIWSGTASAIIGVYDGDASSQTGSTSCSLGSVKYFAIAIPALANLQNALWANTSIDDTVMRADYIASCRIIPASAVLEHEKTQPNKNIKFGLVDSGIAGTLIDVTSPVTFSKSITVPKHPKTANHWWLNKSPYASYTLYHPTFGSCNIPAEQIINSSSLTLEFIGDRVSGQGILKVKNSQGNVVATMSGEIYPAVTISSQAGLSSALGQVASGVVEDLETIGGALVGNQTGLGASAQSTGNRWKDAFQYANAGAFRQIKNWWNDLKDESATLTAIDNLAGSMTDSIQNLGTTVQNIISTIGFNIGGVKVGGVPEMQTVGGVAGLALQQTPMTLTAYFADVREIGGVYGKPVNNIGYLKYYNGMVNVGAMKPCNPNGALGNEISMINNLMKGVIWVE